MSNSPPTKPRLVLHVRGIGNVPSFKNTKKIIQLKINGKLRPSLATDPKKARWMESCIQSFVCQLYSSSLIADVATSLACSRQSAIALCTPEDDSWLDLEIGFAKCQKVDDGEEGVCVIIVKNEKDQED